MQKRQSDLPHRNRYWNSFQISVNEVDKNSETKTKNMLFNNSRPIPKDEDRIFRFQFKVRNMQTETAYDTVWSYVILPSDITSSPSLFTFKQRLKMHALIPSLPYPAAYLLLIPFVVLCCLGHHIKT